MIVSFEDYTPPARFDSQPWTEIRIEESATSTLSTTTVWTQIDLLMIATDVDPAGLDPDPSAPETRSFTTSLASSTPDLWYRVTFIDGAANESLPSTPVQNLENAVAAYATVTELFRILKIRTTPTPEQTTAAQGDLDTATIEINAELDWASDHLPATAEQLELLRTVCLDRAADLWRHRESLPGLAGVLDDAPISTPGYTRYSWERYAQRLIVLKDQWGVA